MIETSVDQIIQNLLDPNINIIDKRSLNNIKKFNQLYNELFKKSKMKYF